MNWPIEQIYQQLDEVLLNQGQCVIVAPPGAGKSTLLPLHLLGVIDQGMIILVEPRRVAARAVARRLASLLGEEVGQTVGYAMRLERKQNRQTRLLVVTEGIFTHMLLENPELNNISAVLFDEFHERSLDADFGLALALDVRGGLRPDLKLIVMSATLDGARVANLMGDALVLETQGRQFEVEIRYRPLAPEEQLEPALSKIIMQILAQEHGNILVFLPGQKEIEHTKALLEGQVGSHILIAPLYGALSAQAQDRAIQSPPAHQRKVVLATSIAQTSLTIEGVRIVIDSGLSRIPIYEADRGITRLKTVQASQADIEQRRGRAGRLEPGIALRLWGQGQTRSRPPFVQPEILSADLSALLLDCVFFGVHDPSTLAFLDPPPQAACDLARVLLWQLGALDNDGRLTPIGGLMRRLALPVRYAHMVASNPSRQAAELALLLSERGLGGTDIDIENRLKNFSHDKTIKAQKIRKLADKIIAKIPDAAKKEDLPLSAMLMQAWPDRVARARGQYGQFLLANGRGAQIDIIHPLAKAEWLVVADLTGQAQSAKILAALATDEATIRDHLSDKIKNTTRAEFDSKTGTIRAMTQEKLASLSLSNSPLAAPAGDIANQAWIKALRQHGTGILPWDKSTLGLRQRLNWLHHQLGGSWPEITEESFNMAIQNFLPGKACLKNERELLPNTLLSLVPYDYQRQIDQWAPPFFIVPTGSKIALDYESSVPVLRVRVQELFGLNTHPAIARGQVNLVVELLSPANRPIQITRDLPQFWRGSWAEVRAQMRGRYPKHVWPEDPANALPTRRAKSRMS